MYGNAAHTLVGFAAELDWRPLRFVRPIPRINICSTCGLVRNRTALLPCMHTLCESCYQQCAEEGGWVCPLDDLQCPEEDIKWMAFTAEEMLRREVTCWNQENGCTAVLAASNISQHHQRDCGYHCVHCPKCSVSVLCRNLCAHLRSGCASSRTPFASELGGATGPREEPPASTSSANVPEKQVGYIKAPLDLLLSNSRAQGDTLDEVSHGLNSLKESLSQKVAKVAKHSQDTLTQSVRHITASYELVKDCVVSRTDRESALSCSTHALFITLRDDLSNATRQSGENIAQLAAVINALLVQASKHAQEALDYIIRVIKTVEVQVAHCEFVVKGVKSLQDKALKEGSACYESAQVYLRGYCLSPGVHLKKAGESVTLHLRFQLHKGDMDDIVVWPLEHRVRFSVVHPVEGAKRQLEFKPQRSSEFKQRPTEVSNKAFYKPGYCLNLSDLIRDGYLHKDELRVQLELLL